MIWSGMKEKCIHTARSLFGDEGLVHNLPGAVLEQMGSDSDRMVSRVRAKEGRRSKERY